MKAMIFAAGLGSRLGELTKSTPKCLVKLSNGLTMLDVVVGRLTAVGVTEIIINLFYRGDAIIDHVQQMNQYGVRIEFSAEETLLGTGGGLKKAGWFFQGSDEPFFVHNSDVYSDLDLQGLLAAHVASAAYATLAVMHRPTKRALLFDESLALAGWENDGLAAINVEGRSAKFRMGFSGVQVLSPSLLPYLAAFEGSFSTIPVFMAAAREGRPVMGYDVTSSQWLDMGTPEHLNELNKLLGGSR